jgi:F0F1-type ATP synthase gamma subunit
MFFDRDEKEVKKTKIESTMYFLVDPKKLDVYSQNMLDKLEETLIKTVTPNDYIITFGSNVNIICQKLELNVIEHFEYSSFENLEELSQKVSALIDIGLKNNLFSKALMLITQASNLHSEPVVSKQILPFESILASANNKKQKLRTDNKEPEDDSKTRSVHEYIVNHKKIMTNINIDNAE